MKIALDVLLEDKKIMELVRDSIRQGKVLIYPTDTVYGLGCDATNAESVKRIRDIKGSERPMSVIAPSKDWIKKNLVVKEDGVLDVFPGSTTLIFKKRGDILYEASHTERLGVRIPDHPLIFLIQETGLPFITTSCNLSGQETIKSIKEIPKQIQADIIIDGGVLEGRASKVIDLSGDSEIIIRG